MQGKRTLLSWMIDASRLGRAVTRLSWSRRLSGDGYAVLVLNYHRIGPSDETPFDRGCFSATADQFEQHLLHLKRRCTIVSLDQFDALTDPNRSRPPKRPVLLTFDDGYADNYHLALPLLKKHSVPAVFFPTTAFIDRTATAWWDEIAWLVRRLPTGPFRLPNYDLSIVLAGPPWQDDGPADRSMREPRGGAIRETLEAYKKLTAHRAEAMLAALRAEVGIDAPTEALSDLYLTWDQLREMQDAGMAIGGHTMIHPVLARLSEQEQRDEIVGCRDRLREQLGVAPTAFSYPVGRPGTFTEQTEQIVRDAGFRWGFQFFGGLWRLGTDRQAGRTRLAIPRLPVHSRARDHEFRTQLAWPKLFVE